MHSFCHHLRDDTYRARLKPTWAQDLRSFREAFRRLNEPLMRLKNPRKCHITLGNHENWAYTYEDNHPAMVGTITGAIEGLFEEFGWTHSPYGAWYMLGGVGCTHVPFTLMAKPFGGKNSERTVAMRATFDIVYGHTQRRGMANVPKLGTHNKIKVINVGSSMPNWYVGDYAKYAPNGMDYGVLEVVIQDGHIQTGTFVTMTELKKAVWALSGLKVNGLSRRS